MKSTVKIKRTPRRKTGVVRVLPKAEKAEGHTSSFDETLLKAADRSNALGDPFESDYTLELGVAHSSVINPDADLNAMANVVTVSNILRQCIEAMVTNTTSFGYTLEYIGPEGHENDAPQQDEKKMLQELLDNPAPGESLRDTFEKMQWDKESIGYRAMECIRDENGERVISFNHIPAITLRKTRQDRRPTQYYEERINDEGVVVRKLVARRFRRYIQRIGSSKIFFKEFGDPRDIDMRDGSVIPPEELEERRDFVATEILWDEFYTPGKQYGQPRWIGVLPEILGSRESVLVNLNFFRENAIPAMAVMVSGGALTQDTFENLSQYITAVKGSDAMQRILILEASADELGSTEHSAPAPKIEMKPMISERQQDGLFREYDIHNITKVRSAFRLPPILVGKAEDYTRASALASIKTAEDQVFLPERTRNDDMVNNKILATYNPRFWRYRSNGPVTTDSEDLAKILDALGAQGALTPNVVIKLANKMLGIYIEPVMDDWGDYPFELITAYAAQGAKIKGLDKFIEQVQQAVSTEPASKPPAATDDSGEKPVKPLAKARQASRRQRGRAAVLRLTSSLQTAA